MDSWGADDPILNLGISYSYGVPYVPTDRGMIDEIIKLLSPRPGDVIYDLGCGDGRICLEILSRFSGVRCTCIEIRRDLAKMAMENAKMLGVSDRLKIINEDFFKVNLSEATAIYIYLLTDVNRLLKPKFSRELRRGTRIVSLDFEIPGWRPYRVHDTGSEWQGKLYLYIVGYSNRPRSVRRRRQSGRS